MVFYLGYTFWILTGRSREIRSFITRMGLYQFHCTPFGLTNAPSTFERLMENVLVGFQWEICLIYQDDIVVMAKLFNEMIHVHSLLKVFVKLQGAGLKLKPKNCHLIAKKVTFIGHLVSESGVATDLDKIKCIK